MHGREGDGADGQKPGFTMKKAFLELAGMGEVGYNYG